MQFQARKTIILDEIVSTTQKMEELECEKFTELPTTTELPTEVEFIAIPTLLEKDSLITRIKILTSSVKKANKCHGEGQLNCLNGGICVNLTIPNDEYLITCKCVEGFMGDKCEYSGYLLEPFHEE